MSYVFPWCIFTHLPVPSSVPVDTNVRQQVAQRPAWPAISLSAPVSLYFVKKKKCTKEQSHVFILMFSSTSLVLLFFSRLLKAKFRTKPCMHLKLTTEHASIHYLFCSTFPITELSQPERALFESEVAVYGCPASVSR